MSGDKCCGDKNNDFPKPAWFKCPPKNTERMYPVPDGAKIIPISEGGRNGKKKASVKCGQCGGEARRTADVKPNAPADCPMMKMRCADESQKSGQSSKSGSGFMDKFKGIFGKLIIKNPDSPLMQACKRLVKEGTDYNDLFEPTLLCDKEGYFSPLFTKVDCQGVPMADDDEECEEYEEDDDEDDEDCEWEEDDNEYEDEDEEGICVDGEEEEGECVQEEGECIQKEEECIQDKEGECVLEETAECTDDSCKLFLDPKDSDFEPVKVEEKKEEKKECENPCKSIEDDCIAMNNFIIKLQAPVTPGKTPNETCEMIVNKLTSNALPEPDKKCKRKARHPMVIREISVMDPTCECLNPKVVNKNEVEPEPACAEEPKPPPESPPAKEASCEGTPPPPAKETSCETETPKVLDCPPAGQEGPCNQQPAEADYCMCPYQFSPRPNCPCRVKEEEVKPPPPPPEENNKCRPCPRRTQNDCEVLSEEELLKLPIKDINCGIPKEVQCNGYKISYVWTPPAPPKCARCGADERGTTDSCYLCSLTRTMRSGCPQEDEKPISFKEEIQEMAKSLETTGECEPEYLEDGSIKYKGGMCMETAGEFLRLFSKRTPPGGYFDRYTGECGEEERMKAATGAETFSEACSAMNGCKRPCDMKMEYEGDCLENCRNFLWGIKKPSEAAEEKRCRKPPEPEKPAKAANQCPQPSKGWLS